MMKKYSILIYLLLFAGFSSAQTYMNRDSLLKLLPKAQDGPEKVDLLINIGQQYEFNDYTTAKQYYIKAKQLSEKINYPEGVVKYIANYTYILNAQGKYDAALVLNKQAIKLSNKLKNNLLIAKSYINYGNSFNNIGMIDSALYYYEMGKSYFEKTTDSANIYKVYGLMAIAYRQIHQNKKAIALGEKEVAYYKKSKDIVNYAIALSNLGTYYATILNKQKSLSLFNQSLKIADEINFKELKQTLLLNIGDLYIKNFVVDSMKVVFSQALALGKETEMPTTIAKALRGLAIYHTYKKDFTEAKKYIDQSLAICKEHSLTDDNLKSLETKSGILYAMQDIFEAEKILQQVTKLNDSLIGIKVSEQVVITEKRFETQKKDAQIQLQQVSIRQKNTFNYILIGGAIALLTIILLGYRNYTHRQKLQTQRIAELETEKQLTATEAVLKGEEQERTRLAKDLHDGLGGMLSGLKHSFGTMKGNLVMTPENTLAFNRSMDMLDSSIKEMRRVAHNMMPEALVKFGLDVALKDFCTDINLAGALQVNYQSIEMEDTNLDNTTAITIFRVVQELLNNTMKHAAASHVIVQLAKTEQTISVTVEDDGKGFEPQLLHRAEGIGWSNIKNRVDFLKGKIDIKSEPNKGTSVLIEFKL